jgi:hypothetical protein
MPLITLTTDYGTVDSYIGEIRGVLLGAVPGVTLVDIAHNIAPGDVRAAAYVLGRAWRSFPAGTVHLAVVDPGVGTGQAALAVRVQGHVFVAPDNGLLSGPLGSAMADAAGGSADVSRARSLRPGGGGTRRGTASPGTGLALHRGPAAARHGGAALRGEVDYR